MAAKRKDKAGQDSDSTFLFTSESVGEGHPGMFAQFCMCKLSAVEVITWAGCQILKSLAKSSGSLL